MYLRSSKATLMTNTSACYYNKHLRLNLKFDPSSRVQVYPSTKLLLHLQELAKLRYFVITNGNL